MVKNQDLIIKIDYLNSLNDINQIKKEISLINFKDIENSNLRELFLQTRSIIIKMINNGENINAIKANLNSFIEESKRINAREIVKIEKEKAKKELNLAKTYLDRGKILDRRDDFIRTAIKMGYDISENVKEGTLVKWQGKTITVIPKHPKILRGTAISIMKDLANKESSFRKLSFAQQNR